ncbi:MAG TPA: substrate-binding domain-containing protein, partial [Longimicrobiales bacterium]|nr:substrate-binding domain-containing protein [Longimicrobiales bacterium]
RRGDADVLLVHAPAAESTFVAQGHGERRADVMYNDFVLVGPPADPAGLRNAEDAIGAMRRIATAALPFVSRGDDSGTHQKERALWREAGVEPGGDWYVEAGLGMGDVLRVASERTGHTLTDRATYLFLRDRLDLDVLLEGDPRLFNQYGVIPVVGARNANGARAFTRWITSTEAQSLIGQYGAERFGQPLFTPNASPAP